MPELSEIQREIVESNAKTILVIAGPGSGKTRVLTFKVAHLISQGVPEDEIMLLTFTNKAAKNMVQRIEKKIHRETKIVGGTFHHVANIFLRKYAHILGYKSNYTIIDESDSVKLIKMILKEDYANNKEIPRAESLQRIYSYSRNSMTSFRDYVEINMSGYLDEMKSIDEIYEKYKKRKTNMMDFDDILLNFYNLINSNSSEVLNQIKNQFKYIFVDEFQDTNKLQFEIIKKIYSEENNLFVVGDDCQSIYSFRAAEIRNILNFPKIYPQTKTYYLTENYRSSKPIVSFVNNIIENNKFKFEKKLISKNDNEINKPKIFYFNDQKEEAKEIINEVTFLINEEKVSPNEIAILYRSNFLSAYFEMELAKNNIKYIKLGGMKFFESAHVKDVISFLKISSELIDELALIRLLMLFEGIGEVSAQKVWKTFSQERNLIEQILEKRNKKLNPLIVLLRETEKLTKPEMKVKLFIDSFYRNYLLERYNENYEDRLNDLQQLIEIVSVYSTLDEFLEDAILDANLIDNTDSAKLTLSTVHQSKGLEWERVYVVGMIQGKFPSKHAIDNFDKLEEERRLFYVACSRAKYNLQLSVPLVETFTFDRDVEVSQFITELSEEYYNQDYKKPKKNKIKPLKEFDDFVSADSFL